MYLHVKQKTAKQKCFLLNLVPETMATATAREAAELNGCRRTREAKRPSLVAWQGHVRARVKPQK